MGILDAALLVGAETTYGTAATLTRAYEAKADTWKREPEFLESVGMRSGIQTIHSARRKKVDMGAKGNLEFDLLTNGMGLIFDGLLGSTTGPSAGVTTINSTKDGSSKSFTFQVIRPRADGGTDPFSYLGAVATGWKISQDVGGLAKVAIDFDAQAESTSVAAGTPTYPTASAYDWTQCAVTVNASSVIAKKIEVGAALGMKTDRRGLRASALKRQPRRNSVPEYTGSIAVDYEDLTLFNLFAAGTIVPIVFSWTVDASTSVTVTMQACQFNGESPNASLDDLTGMDLPFKVLWDGTNPAVSIVIKSSDVAL